MEGNAYAELLSALNENFIEKYPELPQKESRIISGKYYFDCKDRYQVILEFVI